MVMRYSQSITKKYYLIFITVILFLLIGFFALQAKGKKDQAIRTEQRNVQNDKNSNASTQGEKLTAWNIVKMTDWLFWPFIVITAAGIMLISYRALYEHREKSRAQDILQRKIRVNDIRRFIHVIRNSHPCRISQLMRQMISTYNKTNQAEPINADVNQFLNTERESYETFNRITGFFSDSAGALGLLGTVWGIFQTFHAGKLDGPTILQGMSISLVTTLVGLIISLFINMGSTFVFAIFNEQLKLTSGKAEELRQTLMYLEKKTTVQKENVNGETPNFRVVDTNLRYQQQNRVRKPLDVSFKSL